MRPTSPYLNDATTCPFHHFADGLLLGRGNAPCRRQELVAKLVESRTSSCHCWAQAKKGSHWQVVWQTRSRQKPWNRCQEAESRLAGSTERCQGSVSVGEAASADSVGEEPFCDAG